MRATKGSSKLSSRALTPARWREKRRLASEDRVAGTFIHCIFGACQQAGLLRMASGEASLR